jgi:hypothetical protein
VIDFTMSPILTFLSVNPSFIVFSGGTVSEAIEHSIVLTAKARTSSYTKTVAFKVNAIDCTPKNLIVAPNMIKVPRLA